MVESLITISLYLQSNSAPAFLAEVPSQTELVWAPDFMFSLKNQTAPSPLGGSKHRSSKRGSPDKLSIDRRESPAAKIMPEPETWKRCLLPRIAHHPFLWSSVTIQNSLSADLKHGREWILGWRESWLMEFFKSPCLLPISDPQQTQDLPSPHNFIVNWGEEKTVPLIILRRVCACQHTSQLFRDKKL